MLVLTRLSWAILLPAWTLLVAMRTQRGGWRIAGVLAVTIAWAALLGYADGDPWLVFPSAPDGFEGEHHSRALVRSVRAASSCSTPGR